MNIEEISKKLKKDYNCIAINFFEYGDKNFAKCLEDTEHGIKYRYFYIVGNEMKEVLDEEVLNYFRETQEINSDIIY